RGADVVRQLTTFAKGAEGRKGPVQPRHLLKEMSDIVSGMFPKSIRLACHAPADLWTVQAVPTQIHQVLLNLAVNARDAMPEGGQLSLAAENVRFDDAAARVRPGAKAGPYVVLRIADTGTGIDPGIADHVFDPFFTTKGPDKGTGLGLSTVMGIVRSHSGFIEFTSHRGQGTEFRVYLPACPVEAAGPAAPAAPEPPRGRGELILVVDDEPALRSVMKRTLEKYGYRTLTAHDGAQAVALYSQRGTEISLVITDLDMPTMDGAAAAGALLSMNPGVKIMVATGVGSFPSGRTPVPAGCRAVLKKPCNASLLLQTINAVLRGERPPQEKPL
ncbi:MAG: ATP-binding protein, partial [Verrucomicrobiota bacterium]